MPLVVIFGRTNVGKSTLFNCLTEEKKALVSKREGTTRDSNLSEMAWGGTRFTLVDTGGITDTLPMPAGSRREAAANDIDLKVQRQARQYLKRADLILFLVDARDGLLPQDRSIARDLKKAGVAASRVFLVANKADSPALRRDLAEFNKLAFGEPIPVSAATGSGTGDLLDLVIEKFAAVATGPDTGGQKSVAPAEPAITVGIIGKPNVGKSSLINSLLGEDRVIVSPLPHTTREPQDVPISYGDHRFVIIDTAGVSKRGQKEAKPTKAHETLEKFSILRTLKTLKRADLAILIVDVSQELTHQESKLVEEIIKTKTSFCIVANKWDLVGDRDTKHYTEYIYGQLPFARWAPIVYVSALTGEKMKKILPLLVTIAAERQRRIEPSALEKLMKRAVKKHLPVKGKGAKYPHIYELKQSGFNPPQFTIRIGARTNLHYSYVRFIENRIREKYGFLGTPISIYVEKNKLVHGKHEEKISNL